jgi:hypothetical protein
MGGKRATVAIAGKLLIGVGRMFLDKIFLCSRCNCAVLPKEREERDAF